MRIDQERLEEIADYTKSIMDCADEGKLLTYIIQDYHTVVTIEDKTITLHGKLCGLLLASALYDANTLGTELSKRGLLLCFESNAGRQYGYERISITKARNEDDTPVKDFEIIIHHDEGIALESDKTVLVEDLCTWFSRGLRGIADFIDGRIKQ